jgi:hypothetical protein
MARATEEWTVPAAAATPTRRRHPALVVAAVLGLLGVGYRLAMLLVEVPPLNSDEATSGLVALHVAQGRDFPLFFYGQYYMGALESYLAAPLFALFGSSTLALRLPNLVLYAAFLVLIWRLTRRLYTPWLAAVTVGLLALGSDRILKNQLIAGGGYPEMNPAGVLLLLLAVNLGLGAVRPLSLRPMPSGRKSGALRPMPSGRKSRALRPMPSGRKSRALRPMPSGRKSRAVAYAGFGLVAGLTLWDDWLILPYVAAAGAVLLAFGWRELRGRAGRALGAGLLIGLLPIVLHNLTAAPEHRSLAIYSSLRGGAASLGDRLYGGVLFGVPMGTGLCAPSRCESWQLWWGVAYPVLLFAAGVLAARALWRASRVTVTGDAANGDERVRQAGRLALVVGAALSLLAYATSSAAGRTPVESARYLSCLLISTPAVLWPLWSAVTRPGGVGRRPAAPLRRATLTRLAAVLPLAALVVTMAVATGALIRQAPALGREAENRQELVSALDRLGVTRFYSEYWTCNNITFLTRERLVCAVIRDDLRAGWDRYPPHRDLVRRADRPAYVLPAGTALSDSVAGYLRRAGPPVTVTTAAGYDIYLPSGPVGLPLR